MNLEKKGNRKEWVKNVAIIFLSIMLVLTFFSNTIMNYSLPEVATSVIEPGSITAKIRGTGTLTSDDPYKIMIEETRVISSVAVKAGDTVEKDQVLFYLEDKESDELEAAEKELNDLILAFCTTLLKGDITDQSYQNIQSGNLSNNNGYQARINEAKAKVEAAKAHETAVKANSDSLQKQIDIAGTTSSSSVDKQTAKKNAETELSSAQIRLSAAKEKQLAAKTEANNLETENAKYDSVEMLSLSANSLKIELDEKKDNFNNQQNSIKLQNPDCMTATIEEISQRYGGNIYEYMAYLNKYIEEKNMPASEFKDKEGNVIIINDLSTIYVEYIESKDLYEEAQAAVSRKQELISALPAVKNNVAAADREVIDAENYVKEVQAKIKALENEIANNEAGKEKQKNELTTKKYETDSAVKEAENGVKKAEEELAQLLTDVSAELNLGSQNSIIQKKREEVEKLREKSIGSTITAPVAGIVTSVNVTAGEKTDASRELAIMQPEGKGYSMSFSVTTEQAKKVKVGEIAEVQNSWFYSDIEATLTGIRPDPENANEKKLLVFDVKGDVQAGQSVSLSIGQRSAEYDLLVPNSAVREDNQGKFILIVESKSSPLGNRYMAKRVDVQVLGADDLKTAISAPLFGYEYVITTATQPVEAGKQVRLAETN